MNSPSMGSLYGEFIIRCLGYVGVYASFALGRSYKELELLSLILCGEIDWYGDLEFFLENHQ